LITIFGAKNAAPFLTSKMPATSDVRIVASLEMLRCSNFRIIRKGRAAARIG